MAYVVQLSDKTITILSIEPDAADEMGHQTCVAIWLRIRFMFSQKRQEMRLHLDVSIK